MFRPDASTLSARTRPSPKSSTFAWPFDVSITLEGFQITMDDVLVVRSFERLGNLSSQFKSLFNRQRTSRQPVRERLAINQLHDEELRAALLVESVDGSDVWVIERGQELRLTVEAGHAVRPLRHVLWEDLDCDLSLELRVLRPGKPPPSRPSREGRGSRRRRGGFRRRGASLYLSWDAGILLARWGRVLATLRSAGAPRARELEPPRRLASGCGRLSGGPQRDSAESLLPAPPWAILGLVALSFVATACTRSARCRRAAGRSSPLRPGRRCRSTWHRRPSIVVSESREHARSRRSADSNRSRDPPTP